jgi:zinc resistance-associated protein
MERTISKKKIMLAAILSSGLALAISQSALAEPATQPDAQTKQVVTPRMHRMDPDMQKAHEKFLGDTVAIRKQFVEKTATMKALSKAQTPDATKISQLAGEVFDLREQLRVKAKEAGLPMGMGMGMGMGMMDMGDVDSMPCQGMGGRGGKHHMM